MPHVRLPRARAPRAVAHLTALAAFDSIGLWRVVTRFRGCATVLVGIASLKRTALKAAGLRSCAAKISKNGACPQMKCRMCNTDFRW